MTFHIRINYIELLFSLLCHYNGRDLYLGVNLVVGKTEALFVVINDLSNRHLAYIQGGMISPADLDGSEIQERTLCFRVNPRRLSPLVKG